MAVRARTKVNHEKIQVSHSIRKTMDRKPSRVLIGCDFNFKEIDWEHETTGVKQHI